MSGPTIHNPQRDDELVEIDRLWHRAMHAEDADIRAGLIAEHNRRRQAWALKAPEPGALSGPGASLQAIGV